MYWIAITGGGRRPPKPGRALSPSSPPPSPQGGGGVGGGNQSCLTDPLSVWSYDTCQVKKVNAIEGGIRLASDWHQTGMRVAWPGMEWHGMASFILDI